MQAGKSNSTRVRDWRQTDQRFVTRLSSIVFTAIVTRFPAIFAVIISIPTEPDLVVSLTKHTEPVTFTIFFSFCTQIAFKHLFLLVDLMDESQGVAELIGHYHVFNRSVRHFTFANWKL